jgi:thiamine-phosphate pyrophosphorylase
MEATKLSGGIYLVIDPLMHEHELLKKLSGALNSGIAAVQIWDNFPSSADVENLIQQVCEICHNHKVPVFINNRWQLLNTTALDGVHFDKIPEDFDNIKDRLGSHCMIGITVNNDLSVVRWAEKNKLAYISFCSIFPSTTSNSCELVTLENVIETRNITSMPLFLAGGIRPENINKLKELDFDGIAVVSGIMSSNDPQNAAKNYLTELKNLNK